MDVTLFWIVAATTALAVAATLVRGLLRGGLVSRPAASYDMNVYRDQLGEVERDLARGTIPAEEADRLRNEIARRLLAADAAASLEGQGSLARGPAPLISAVLLAGVVVAAGGAVYISAGAPGYPDIPLAQRIAEADMVRANRPDQDVAEADWAARRLDTAEPPDPRHAQLMDQLRSVTRERPDDVQGQELLARNEALLGNFDAAWRAQAQMIALKGPASTSGDHAALAELMVRAAGGYISPQAEAALAEALRRDPRNGPARFYSGLMFSQVGRHDMAWRFWRSLWNDTRPDDPWANALRAQSREMAWRAGDHRWEMPAAFANGPAGATGPDAAQIEAAAGMSPDDRAAMIGTMVAGLAERLANEGGPAADWARLIRAYGVLGQTERASAIYGEAKTAFAGRDADLAELAQAAQAAGLRQ